MRILIATCLCFLALGSFSQTGPGGVGATANMVFWYDADQLGLSNGTGVNSLTDVSGNGTTASGTNGPTFNTNQVNGRPALNFNGTSELLEFTSENQLNSDGSISWYVVASSNSEGTMINTSYSNDPICWGMRHFTGTTFYGRAMRLNTANSGGSYAYSAGYNIHGGIWDNGSSSFDVYLNSTNVVSKSNADGNPATHIKTTIGANVTNGVNYFDGGMAELFLYSDPLNSAEQAIVENYLAAKYGITISNDLYSFQGSHDEEVAGIGQEADGSNTTARGTGIVTIAGADDLDNSEYLIWGHNGGAFASQTTEIPGTLSGGTRVTREWVADETGDVGTVDITFDMTGLSLGASPDGYRILTDADGDFSNGNDNSAITPVVAGNSITFNNVDLSSEPFFTIAHENAAPEECISFSSDDWDANPLIIWDCGVTPDSTKSVTIDVSTIVTIDADASCYNLLIEAGGTLLLSPGVELVIKGDSMVLNSGVPDASIFCGAGSSIVFRGSEGSAQTIVNSTAAPVDFANLVIANNDGLIVAPGSEVEVSEGLFLNGGSLTNNGTFTFTSDATSTGHIANVNGSSTITGNINVQRFRSARPADWSTIGNSGVTTDIEDLDDDIYISGIVGADGFAAGSGGGGFVSMAYYDNVSDAYVVPNNTAESFVLGRGYEVWLGDNLTTWSAQAWTLDGPANTATASLSVNAGGGGWNLLANPYPAFLDFGVINTDNPNIVGNEWWYYDADIASYNSNGTAVDIPPGQGFWIDWSSGSGSIDLDITTDIVDLSTSTYYKTDEKEELRIGIRQDSSIFGSAVFLRKDPMAFAGVDENDLTPLRLPDPRASHLVMEYAGEDMMLNYVSDYEDHIEIPMRFEPGLPGDYTMTFKGLDYFDDYQCINIIDEEDGKQIQITPSTSLKVSIGDDLAERKFKLLLSKADYEDCLAPEDLTDEDIRITSVGKTIVSDFFLDRNANAEITIYNVLGAPVLSTTKSVGYSRETFNMDNLQSGLYVVNITINGSTTTEKVILQ